MYKQGRDVMLFLFFITISERESLCVNHFHVLTGVCVAHPQLLQEHTNCISPSATLALIASESGFLSVGDGDPS